MKLLELEGVTLFHGDHFGTTELTAQWMMHESSNNQEGVGIYFSPDIKVAESYGPKVSKLELSKDDLQHIVPARSLAIDLISEDSALGLLSDLSKHEEFWYLLTDYGMEISEPEEIESYHLQQLYLTMGNTEIRNFQIELVEACDIQTFVPAWNANIGIYGMFESVSNFYSIINTELQVVPVNF